MQKSITLISGGLDSTVNLALAKQKTEPVLSLTFDYGQKSARKEIQSARRIARFYKIKHKVIELPWLAKMTRSSLTSKERQIPKIDEEDLDNRPKMSEFAKMVWVPNRNAIFINVAAALAETAEATLIVTGFNREEAMHYPDNSIGFVEAINKSLKYSLGQKIKVKSYTQNLSKSEIVDLGTRLNIPFHLLWVCYNDGEKMCGYCESCLRLIRASKDTKIFPLLRL